MEYSSDDIAAARSLQFSSYIYASTVTFWIYDYACSLHEEWIFLLQSRWCKVKGLNAECFPILTQVLVWYQSFSPNVSLVPLYYMCVSDLIHPGFFILRTYALWNNNRVLLAAMASTFFVSSQSTHHTQASGRCISQAIVVASFSIVFASTVPAAYSTSAIPGITGCYQSSTNFTLLIPFLLLSAYQLGLMMLTFIRAMQNWRIIPSRLYVVLLNHDISYYACGLLFSVTNIFTRLLLQYTYQSILHSFQFMILVIIATRMHLHLWQVNRHPHRSGALVRIPISDMSSVNSTA
ncbi:hypothetical protein F4604DRAFT_1049083 [Suillus subluteus]|nr:hypothetical protein F4604DRAFT_1049083 [Suillus subluteus]